MTLSSEHIHNVALFGVPRSGTTWLGQIFNSSPNVFFCYQPLFSYEFKDRLGENSSKEDIDKFHNDLLRAKSDFVMQKKTLSGGTNVSFSKNKITALVWKEVHHINIIDNLLKNSDTKLVLIVRNPKATIGSWIKIPKEFDPSWNLADQWRSGSNKNDEKRENYFGYDKWKEAVKIFLKAERDYPNKVMIVSYPELNDNTEEMVNRLYKFIGLRVGKQTKNFISSSKQTNNDDPYSVYRNNHKDDKWKMDLPTEIANEIDNDLKGTELERFNR